MKKGMIELVENFIDSKLRQVHTMLPGKIVNYDEVQRKATIKMLIRLRTVEGTVLSIPEINNVPVIFPSGQNFSLTWPLEKNDGVEVRFSEEGLGAFLKGKTEVDGDSFARFVLTDAVCQPGLNSFKNIPVSKATIKADKNGNININNGDEGAARLNDDVKSTIVEDSTYWNWLVGFVNVFLAFVPVPGDGGAALKAAMVAYIIANPVPLSLLSKIIEASGSVNIG